MRNIMKMFDDIDEQMNNLFADICLVSNYNRRNALSALPNYGLKSIIHRPHNLITLKDKDGAVIAYKLEVVYTPFSKNDVDILVSNNVLTVSCGTENKAKDDTNEYNYCGVSYQAYQFSLPLPETIDSSKITAKADDGMLKIEMPVKAIEAKKEEPLKIAIQ